MAVESERMKELMGLLPAEECWNINKMPHSCHNDWEVFYLKLVRPGPEGMDLVESQAVFAKALEKSQSLPRENFGIPKPPAEDKCGPNRDGTWPRRGSELAKQVGYNKTILPFSEYSSCQIQFQKYSLQCKHDFMYLDTPDCSELIPLDWKA